MFKAGDPRLGGNTIDVSTLRQMVREYKNAATATAKGLGVNPFEKEDKKAAKNARLLDEPRILVNCSYKKVLLVMPLGLKVTFSLEFSRPKQRARGANGNSGMPGFRRRGISQPSPQCVLFRS